MPVLYSEKLVKLLQHAGLAVFAVKLGLWVLASQTLRLLRSGEPDLVTATICTYTAAFAVLYVA